MDQKRLFIAEYLTRSFSTIELCRRFGVSRPTAYKWISRFLEQGYPGLEDQSRRPLSCPHETESRLVERILELRQRHPFWGPKKLRAILNKRHPAELWPARSTIASILNRHGCIEKKRRRTYPGHPGKPETRMKEPNETWCADFKGEFKTLDGVYCYPLTITDGCSRYLLTCQGLPTTSAKMSKPVFKRIFQEYGLPRIIRTDNGAPFATQAIGRLSRLSAWWIRLGIFPELIQPGKPQQNGRHERMHRTLKRETTRPPAATRRGQQRRFNHFQEEYNTERPHEALKQMPPASIIVRHLESTRGSCRHWSTRTISRSDW
jgi:transposase InsO family protein